MGIKENNHARIYISQLDDEITRLYQSSKEERAKLHVIEWGQYSGEKTFTVLGIMELLSTYLMGFASQIISKGFVSEPDNALSTLRSIQLHDEENFIQWYVTANDNYPILRLYSDRLEHLRTTIIDFIKHHQEANP